MSFDPNSSDAMFAKVLARLDEQDRNAERAVAAANEKLDRIEAQAIKTNGRVTVSEGEIRRINTERKVEKAKIAGMATVASVLVTLAGWAIEHALSK